MKKFLSKTPVTLMRLLWILVLPYVSLKNSYVKVVFSLECQAYLSNTVKNYPIKSHKIKSVKKEMNYVIIISDDKKIYLNKRTDKGIWKNLFEFF